MRAATAPVGETSSWQDRLRDPSLGALLIIQSCAIFIAAPLAANGVPMARSIGETLVLSAGVAVVALSPSRAALIALLLGVAASLSSVLVVPERLPLFATLLHRGGNILALLALASVVGRAVYAPGRITRRRIEGAFVLYLNIAEIFASAYRLIWELNPAAFTNLTHPTGDAGEIATMLYFSLATLTTTGYGDIVPVDAFARSLATLEAVIGQLYLVTAVAGLVAREIEHRRR